MNGMQAKIAKLLGVDRRALRDAAARRDEVAAEFLQAGSALSVCAAVRGILPHLDPDQRDVVLLAVSSRPSVREKTLYYVR